MTSDAPLPLQSKADRVINTKLTNPELKLNYIADYVGCSYPYARRVWGKYVRERVTEGGSPRPPYSVRGWWLWQSVPTSWYLDCPVPVSVNRNGQKVWRGRRSSLVLHKDGQLFLYPYFTAWEEELRGWVSSWRIASDVDLFMERFERRGPIEYALHTPGVPLNFKVRIRGVGVFKTDTTPYPDGTTEFELSPRLIEDVEGIKKSMTVFAVGMRQHMVLIEEIRQLVQGLQRVVDRLDKKMNQ